MIGTELSTKGIDMDFGTAYDKLAGYDKGQDIAEFLRGEEVKGYKGSEENCPIAQWMQNKTGEIVMVNGDAVARYCDLDDEDPNYEILLNEYFREPTSAMLEFIEKFDNGEFPDLVLEDLGYY